MTGSELLNSTGLERHNYGERIHDEIVIPRIQAGDTLEDVWEDLDTPQRWCFDEFVKNRGRNAEFILNGPSKPFLGDVTAGRGETQGFFKHILNTMTGQAK